ncbi:MAG: restriction endonuclease [Halomonas sp.]|nr:restriction endonuclease [Halomonas sp.]
MSNDTKYEIPDWKELEHLVAMIQMQLSPDASVQHNVMLDGLDSETRRPIRIVIGCKDYSKPVDVKGIEEFQGLVQDVRAQKGALVCPCGFTKSALRRAKKLQIDLYRPVSTGKHKWQAKVTAPVLCDFRSSYMSFGISCSSPKPLSLPYDFYNLPVQDEEGNLLGTSLATAQANWDNGIYPSEPGEHERLSIYGDKKVFIDNGHEDAVEVDLTLGLLVKQKMYLGHLPIEDINGLADEQTGGVVTNAFTLGGLNPEEVEKTWQQVEDVNSLEFQPIFRVVGLDCYGIGT